MTETLSRSSPFTGTVLPEGRPFWIVDGRSYDFTEWMSRHPGGSMWFTQTAGRDISALLHTYHREPARLQKILEKYEIQEDAQVGARAGVTDSPVVPAAADMPSKPEGRPGPSGGLAVPTAQDILPKLGVPPFLLAPDFDARTDLPHLNYNDEGSLLAEIRRRVHTAISRNQLKRYDRIFDAATWAIGIAHVALLGLLITGLIPAWAAVAAMVVTRTSLAGAGHYHLHRKWKQGQKAHWFSISLGKALFDFNYVGTSLIGTDGHVLLHHPYLSSGADVKKTFFDSMLRLHPLLRIPGHTIHKLGIALTGLSLRGREIAKYERPKVDGSSDKPQVAADSARTDFWIMRAWILAEFGLCLGTGHLVAWLLQFFFTLWFNTFLVVASHDFEDSKSEEEEVSVIPRPLRNDWAANQICLSYDLSVVGVRWIDLFLSAGLSPHRVHHVLPWQRSGFANLASEAKVREVCEEVGIAWERPRNLIFERFPAVVRHYLLCPVKAAPLSGAPSTPPPPTGEVSMDPAPGGQMSMPPALGGQVPAPPILGGQVPTPPPLTPSPTPPHRSVGNQIGEFFRYAVGGFRGIGV